MLEAVKIYKKIAAGIDIKEIKCSIVTDYTSLIVALYED